MNNSVVPTHYFFEVLGYAQFKHDQGQEKIQEREFLNLGPKEVYREIKDCVDRLCEKGVLKEVKDNGRRKCYKYNPPDYLFDHSKSLLLTSEAWQKIEELIERTVERTIERVVEDRLRSLYRINIDEIAKDINYSFPEIISVISVDERTRPVCDLKPEAFKIKEDGKSKECKIISAEEKRVGITIVVVDESGSMGQRRLRKADELKKGFSTATAANLGLKPIEISCTGIADGLNKGSGIIIEKKETNGVIVLFTDEKDVILGLQNEIVQTIQEIKKHGGIQLLIYGIDPESNAKDSFEQNIIPHLSIPPGLFHSHLEPQNAYNHFCLLTYAYPLRKNQYLVIYETPNQERDGSSRNVCFEIDNAGVGGCAVEKYSAPEG